MLDLSNFKLTDLDMNFSLHSNLKICKDNFRRIFNFFHLLDKRLKALGEELNPTTIAQKVAEEVTNKRVSFSVNHNLNVNSTLTLTVNDVNFEVHRTEAQTFRITQAVSDTNRIDFSNKYIFTKQKDTGIVLYPIIKLNQDSVEISFTESVKFGFVVVII